MENSICVSAAKEEANQVLSYLLKKDNVRKDLKIIYDGRSVLIPVKEKITESKFTYQYHEFEDREVETSPLEKAITRASDGNVPLVFPEKYIKLGNALIIKENRYTVISRKALEIIADEFGAESIYVDTGIDHSVQRRPDIRLIYGPGGDTKHLENGVYYLMNPERVMFSPGNVNIRGSGIPKVPPGGVVIDFFAGIGYFTLPIAKQLTHATVYACELNPESVNYLERNARLNHIEGRIRVLHGDCRVTTLGLKADHIVMGHFQSADFLNAALRASKTGTLIDFHMLARTEEIETKWTELQVAAARFGYSLDLVRNRRVKSYSVHLWHISSLLKVSKVL